MLRTAEFGETTGVVTSFDQPAGLGVVRGADGREYPFHCTAIADGSRSIEPETEVRFTVVAGQLGRFEATDIR